MWPLGHVGHVTYSFINMLFMSTGIFDDKLGPQILWVGTTTNSPLRRVWRYQRGNQNPYVEEEQTTQWPKEKVQKGKQRSTNHAYKTKDRVTQTPEKTGGELRCSEMVGSSCSTSGTRRVNLVTNPVVSHERGKDRILIMTSGTFPWSCMTQIFHNS
jgi:hypothetical protein